MKIIFFLIFITLTISSNSQNFTDFILKNFLFRYERNPEDLNLRDWLNKLVIDLPNDLIKNETKGYIENLTIYNISLESLITTRKKIIDNKIGVEITLRNAGINIKGKYIFLSPEVKNFLAEISSLTVKLPFYLVKNESGLITEVDTTGFTIDLDKAEIYLDLETSDVIRNIVVGILKGVLALIKTNVIEKNLIKTMNEKLGEVFQKINELITSNVEPDKLNILIDKSDLADVRKSPILGSAAYLLTNLTGAHGPLNLNLLVDLFTNDTGLIQLKKFYNKDIHFEFNLTDKSNNSLGNFEISLDDLNISGLNSWKDFDALQPYDPLQLFTYTNLENLTINISFSLRLKLDNTSKFVENETILYEKARIRTSLQNNELRAYLQIPFNNTRSFQYTHKECLDMDCIIDLIDSNGTGINALSLNETFKYILLEVKEGGDLEEDLDDTISKITDLFITGFNEQIDILINVLLNTTLINLANKKLNEFLYPVTCPGIADVTKSEIDVMKTTLSIAVLSGIFILFIFSPYILCKAFKKGKEEKIIEENDDNRVGMLSDLKDVKDNQAEARYCIDKMPIKWLKEFGRIDPEGASLFLDPRIPLFFRIFLPFAILITVAAFVSSNSGTGASVYAVFNLGRRIEIPSIFDFGLVNSVHDMWVAGSWVLSLLVAVFSGFWPYMKLVLMLISFCMPASILSHKSREKILIVLDATGKFSILDTYVMIMMLVAFHFHVNLPVTEKSSAADGSVVDVFIYAAYGFITLITATLVSLTLSHIITHLHRSLDKHPDENKGEKAEKYRSIMSFAKIKCLGDIPYRIIISLILILTLCLVIAGSITQCFSFYFHGLAGYALDILDIPPHREFSIIDLGISVPAAYEDPKAPGIIFTQIIYFLTVLVIPLAFLVVCGILWFVPMTRKLQTIVYAIAEILNAWSCIDVFVIAIVASLTEIETFTKFIVGDKCDAIDPIIKAYFWKILDGHNTCFDVRTYLEEGCWLFFSAAISFFISSFVILKVCRNALNERLPDHVKEFLKNKKHDRISRVSNINDFSSRTTLTNESMTSDLNNNKNFLAEN